VSALILALALAQTGTLVLCGERFEFSASLAREFAGGEPHLVLEFGSPGLDPLAHADTPAVRPDLSGDWNARREAELLPELARTGPIVICAPTWISCWKHFKPEQKDSRLEQELRAALRAGRTVVACGAAASYCASWSRVTREELRRTRRNPRAEDPNLLVTGLAFAPGWMLDTSDEQRAAGALRLLRAAQHFGNERALYLAGPVAWIVRGGAAEAEVAGSGSAIVFDLAHARRSRGDLREGRLLCLRNGDHLRFEKELTAHPDGTAGADPSWADLGLPFEPVRSGSAAREYHFDWIVQR
jgi:hypothetical protein